MDRILLDSNTWGGLMGLGPSVSYGNLSNAVISQKYIDGFSILTFPERQAAVQLNVLVIFGTGIVDITVHDNLGGMMIFNQVSVGRGTNLGFLGTNGTLIRRIDIVDQSGSEGVQGVGIGYTAGLGNEVPEPASLALWTLMGVASLAAAGWHITRYESSGTGLPGRNGE
jgi:hypothetical protein